MPLFKIIIPAIIQGLAELLPVSGSTHAVVAERFALRVQVRSLNFEMPLEDS